LLADPFELVFASHDTFSSTVLTVSSGSGLKALNFTTPATTRAEPTPRNNNDTSPKHPQSGTRAGSTAAGSGRVRWCNRKTSIRATSRAPRAAVAAPLARRTTAVRVFWKSDLISARAKRTSCRTSAPMSLTMPVTSSVTAGWGAVLTSFAMV